MREPSPWHRQRLPEGGDIDYAYSAISEEPHLRDYWKMVVKRRRLVVLVLLAIFGLRAYLSISQAPLDTATATIKIEPQNPAVMTTIEVMAPQMNAGMYDYYQTQFVLLQSKPLAAKVITELGLGSNPTFTGIYQRTQTSLDRLAGRFYGLVQSAFTYVSELLAPAPPPELTPAPKEEVKGKEEETQDAEGEKPGDGGEEQDAEGEKPEENYHSAELALEVAPGLIWQYQQLLQVVPVRNTRLVQVVF